MGNGESFYKTTFKAFGGKARRQCMRNVGRLIHTLCNLDDIKT